MTFQTPGNEQWWTRSGLTRTFLASVGHPPKSPTASSTSEKTCVVEGRRDASTADADKADVRDSEDVRL
jgi:hypothetical protein